MQANEVPPDEIRNAVNMTVVRPDPLTIIADAVARGFDADQLGKLVALQEHVERRNAEKAYWLAMNACQGEMPAILRDAVNKHTQKRYATYEALNALIRPVYTRHGFSLTFTEDVGAREGFVRVVCDVGHRDGHTRRHVGDYPIDGTGSGGNKSGMNAIQACGSTRSYAKRYLAKDIFALAETDEDNDGESGERLDGNQVFEINSLLEDCEKAGCPVNSEKFYAWLAAGSLADVPASRFVDIVHFLTRKLRKGGAK